MNLEKAYAIQREELLTLRRENQKLRREGAVDRICADYERRLRVLSRENEKSRRYKEEYKADLEKARDRIRYLESHWYSGREFVELYIKWDEEVKDLKKQIAKRDCLLKHYQDVWKKAVLDCQEQLTEDTVRFKELEQEIHRLKTKLDVDSTNSSLPTSKTPINKKKLVPNTRKQTGRKRGGQTGHKKSFLEGFEENEINEIVDHVEENCPDCGSTSFEAGGPECIKDETDYEIKLVKRRHRFIIRRCQCCGKTFRTRIPLHLKEKNQYGANVKAHILSLTNQGFVSINRTKAILDGMFNGQISPSEGYIAKLQMQASRNLEEFMQDLHRRVLRCPILYWDDTVVFVDTKQTCMRFYGDERLALYTAHERKNMEGIMKDGILPKLGPDTWVMHDHNTINYNHNFHFRNIECNQHLLRDLEGFRLDSGHVWPDKMQKLIQQTIHDRNERIEKGIMHFETEYQENFDATYWQILEAGDKEYMNCHNKYIEDEERKLLNRLYKYKENYFAWVRNFSLPTTNNLSERSLRGIKTKGKVSGQFLSEMNARYFARIRSYTETCYRSGISPYQALVRLMMGNPYTVEGLLNKKE